MNNPAPTGRYMMYINDAEDVLDGVRQALAAIPLPVAYKINVLINHKERRNYGSFLRLGIANQLQVADRIDPEHATLLLVERSQMATIRNKLDEVHKVISKKNNRIAVLEAQLDQNNKAKANTDTHALELQHKLEESEKRNATLSAEKEALDEKVRMVMDVLGDIPDQTDKLALEEWAKTFAAESSEEPEYSTIKMHGQPFSG